jgi:hypothetical protein
LDAAARYGSNTHAFGWLAPLPRADPASANAIVNLIVNLIVNAIVKDI